MKIAIAFLGLVAFLTCSPGLADFVPIFVPNSSYLSNTTLVPFTGADGAIVSSTTDGTQTFKYSTPITEDTVPATWSAWNSPPSVETSTPRVGSTAPTTSLTITFSLPAITFGVEIEPDLFQVEPIEVDFFTSSGFADDIPLNVDGFGGALLFAATTHTNPFTSVVITDYAGDDFAIARQRYEAVPEPSFGALLLLLFAGWAILLASTTSATPIGYGRPGSSGH